MSDTAIQTTPKRVTLQQPGRIFICPGCGGTTKGVPGGNRVECGRGKEFILKESGQMVQPHGCFAVYVVQ